MFLIEALSLVFIFFAHKGNRHHDYLFHRGTKYYGIYPFCFQKWVLIYRFVWGMTSHLQLSTSSHFTGQMVCCLFLQVRLIFFMNSFFKLSNICFQFLLILFFFNGLKLLFPSFHFAIDSRSRKTDKLDDID